MVALSGSGENKSRLSGNDRMKTCPQYPSHYVYSAMIQYRLVSSAKGRDPPAALYSCEDEKYD